MNAHILISCRQMQADLPRHIERLKDLGVTWECPVVEQQLSEAELLKIIDQFDAMIAGDDEVTAAVLEAGKPRLRIVSKWGVGVDGIDREAAARFGVTITNTPGAFDDEVADVALGYIIMLLRGLHLIDRAVRSGSWLKIEGTSTASRSLGVIGLGGIGRALARRGLALGMRVLGTDPVQASRDLASADGVEVRSLDELLEQADVISVNCPLTPETNRLLSHREFAIMRPGSYVVNTSRGKVIDEPVLVEGLASGRVAGAALDVFEREPLDFDSPLFAFENVILGSHNASNTSEAVRRTSEWALDNVLRAFGLA